MIDLSAERPMTVLADIGKLNFYPRAVVRKWICLRFNMGEPKFNYHIRNGYFPSPNVVVEGEDELWYDDAGVQMIVDRCLARKWDKPKGDR